MNTEKRPYLALAAIFIVGAVAGFLLKSSLKSKVSSSPDDRKITTVKQVYDFKAATERLDKEMQELQNQQMEGSPNGTAAPSEQAPIEGQQIPPAPGQ